MLRKKRQSALCVDCDECRHSVVWHDAYSIDMEEGKFSGTFHEYIEQVVAPTCPKNGGACPDEEELMGLLYLIKTDGKVPVQELLENSDMEVSIGVDEKLLLYIILDDDLVYRLYGDSIDAGEPVDMDPEELTGVSPGQERRLLESFRGENNG